MPKPTFDKDAFVKALVQGASSTPPQSPTSGNSTPPHLTMINEMGGPGADPMLKMSNQGSASPTYNLAKPNLKKEGLEKAMGKHGDLDAKDQKALLQAAKDPKNLVMGKDGKWELTKEVVQTVKANIQNNKFGEVLGDAVKGPSLKDDLKAKKLLQQKPKPEGLQRRGAVKAKTVKM